MSPSLRWFADEGLDPSDFYPDPPDDDYWAWQEWVERMISAEDAELGEETPA